MQKLTDDYMKKIDVIYKQKEKVCSIWTELFLGVRTIIKALKTLLVGFEFLYVSNIMTSNMYLYLYFRSCWRCEQKQMVEPSP